MLFLREFQEACSHMLPVEVIVKKIFVQIVFDSDYSASKDKQLTHLLNIVDLSISAMQRSP